jgi:hypothetical protein
MGQVRLLAWFAACALSPLLTFASTEASAADAHVHGRAALQVAVDGSSLSLELTTPLDNLIGFEHAPRNEKQRAAVRTMAERLRKPEALFAPSAEAGCKPGPVTLQSDVLEPALLSAEGGQTSTAQPSGAGGKKGETRASESKGKEEHAALSARFVYHCDRAERLSNLEVRLFDVFPGVRRLDVEVAGPRKQVAARLTSKSRRVTW